MIGPIILFVLFVISTYFVVKPFLSTSTGATNPVQDNTPKPEELQKISLLKQIREVEFEREMGITVEEDFQRIRSELVEQVGGLLKRQGKSAKKGSKSLSGTTTCGHCHKSVSPDDKFCGHCGKSLDKTRCGTCGTTVVPEAKFCSGCGAKQV